MKIQAKFTLFLFALGLGMSAAYAYPPVGTCRNNCDYEYRYCIKTDVPGGIPTCLARRDACYDRCDHASPL
ncbi:hypothetical protein ACFOLJ_07400 [Rugamonas sp. CCM 8940]|uniref:hypothetical protein n=1 Tax=Rugamonas sp. CCM 8940 TaxID=2765359 RepID=UPI0018F4E299|nr:hypothetical protein [Rugamonas sp. CCM 8940]MBJ7310223.1 hypothetical protein [Rugamonas sp. CCM 8940]